MVFGSFSFLYLHVLVFFSRNKALRRKEGSVPSVSVAHVLVFRAALFTADLLHRCVTDRGEQSKALLYLSDSQNLG